MIKFSQISKIGILQLSESVVQHLNGGPILKWYPVREILYIHIHMYCISLEIAHPYDKQFCMYVAITCYKFCMLELLFLKNCQSRTYLQLHISDLN